MNIYLDIDGVLVSKYHEPVEGLKEFLERITGVHDCYWLTTHCRDGKNERAVEQLEAVYGAGILESANKIKPTAWQTFKTEAIDFSQDFRWLDDYVMLYEETILKKENAHSKLILINLQTNPKQLANLNL